MRRSQKCPTIYSEKWVYSAHRACALWRALQKPHHTHVSLSWLHQIAELPQLRTAVAKLVRASPITHMRTCMRLFFDVWISRLDVGSLSLFHSIDGRSLSGCDATPPMVSLSVGLGLGLGLDLGLDTVWLPPSCLPRQGSTTSQSIARRI